MRTYNKQISTDVPTNADFNSPYLPLKNIFMYSMVVLFSGTPTGTVKLQASNDPETNDTQYNSTQRPPAMAPTHWVDITDSSFPITSAGETMWNVRDVGYNYVRAVYIDSSGGTSTATMTIIFNGKGT